MELFFATGNQMIYLFTLILIGYVLSRIGILPQGTAKALAILENYVLIPALVIDSFSRNFTVEKTYNPASFHAVYGSQQWDGPDFKKQIVLKDGVICIAAY